MPDTDTEQGTAEEDLRERRMRAVFADSLAADDNPF